MPIESLLNPPPRRNVDTKKQSKLATKCKERMKNKSQARHTLNVELNDHYDVLSALMNALNGMSFCQLWQGDALGARKKLNDILERRKLKLEVLKMNNNALGIEEEKTCLAASPVRVHETDV